MALRVGNRGGCCDVRFNTRTWGQHASSGFIGEVIEASTHRNSFSTCFASRMRAVHTAPPSSAMPAGLVLLPGAASCGARSTFLLGRGIFSFLEKNGTAALRFTSPAPDCWHASRSMSSHGALMSRVGVRVRSRTGRHPQADPLCPTRGASLKTR